MEPMLRKLAATACILLLAGCSLPGAKPSAPPATPGAGPTDLPLPSGPAVSALTPAGAVAVHRSLDTAVERLHARDYRGALAALPPEPDPETYARQRWFSVRSQALAHLGDFAGAADAAEGALSWALGPELLHARLEAGEAFLAAGRPAKAVRALLDAASSIQALYEGDLRRKLVTQLEAIAPALDPRKSDEQDLLLELGELLEAFGMYGEAVRIYERPGFHGDGLIEARFSLAYCYGQLGHREQAAAMFADLIQPDRNEVRMRTLLGREYLLLDREEEAKAQFALALAASQSGPEGQARASRHTARSLEYLVDLALEEEDIAAAYQWLVRAPAEAFSFQSGERSAWEVFLTAYVALGPADDLTYASLLRLEQTAAANSDFRFWRWRIAGERGEEADLLRRALLGEDPLTYYGLLARSLSDPDGCATCFLQEAGDQVAVVDERFERMMALYEAGLTDAAAGELRRHLRLQPRDWEAHYLLATWDAELGLYRESVSSGWAAWQESYLPVPPAPVLRLIYPTYYQQIVEAEAARYDVDPLFLYSLMREESSFEHRALSGADAHGLLQLIPSTAEWMAERERITPLRTEMLFDPALNIRLGAAFVRWLLDWFDGDYTLAAAGYNAGPGAVDGWVDAFGTEDMTLFVERIPYPETREYVKRVERNRLIYHALYAD